MLQETAARLTPRRPGQSHIETLPQGQLGAHAQNRLAMCTSEDVTSLLEQIGRNKQAVSRISVSPYSASALIIAEALALAMLALDPFVRTRFHCRGVRGPVE